MAATARETVIRSALRLGAALILWAAVGTAAEIEIDTRLLDYVEDKFGGVARNRIEAWRDLLDSGRTLSEQEKLRQVNRFFNRMTFTTDRAQWGQEDYWATPVEFLATHGGDCEDFSVAKYFSLREMGVAMDKLSLTYVKSVSLNQAHMVVTFYPRPDAEPLVLDNLVGEILPAGQRPDLLPVYSFNGQDLWLAKERGRGRLVGRSTTRLNLWADLIKRMEQLPRQPGGG